MKQQEQYHNISSVLELFGEQASRTPDNTAVKVGGNRLSYQQMDRLSSKVARYLQKTMKVQKGDVVGVMLEREEYILPVIFGILRAGAVYLPIDPEFPESRVEFMLQDAGASVLFSRTKFLRRLKKSSPEAIDLNKEIQHILSIDGKAKVQLTRDDRAYIIYTSGSTGKPKGVIITHGGLLNVVDAMDQLYPLGENDNYLFKMCSLLLLEFAA